MKIAGKKIPRGNILLFIGFGAVSLCLLLLVSAVRAGRVSAISRNALCTGHQKNFSVYGAKDERQWAEVMPRLASEYNDFAIYVPVKDSEALVKGICIQGEVETPPMIWGHYFNYQSSWTDMPMVVLGKQFQQEIKQRAGKSYYDYGGMEFQVIGVMGTEDESRLNHMVVVDFQSAVKIAGINTDYALDAKRENTIYHVGQKLDSLFRLPADVQIILERGEAKPLVVRILSGDAIMDTMYGMLLVSFSLSTSLVTSLWLGFRGQLFFAWKICGYGGCSKLVETAKRFYMAAGAGFAASWMIMTAVPLFVSDIQIVPSDILQAFGMTLGLGTVILLFCYTLNCLAASGRGGRL